MEIVRARGHVLPILPPANLRFRTTHRDECRNSSLLGGGWSGDGSLRADTGTQVRLPRSTRTPHATCHETCSGSPCSGLPGPSSSTSRSGSTPCWSRSWARPGSRRWAGRRCVASRTSSRRRREARPPDPRPGRHWNLWSDAGSGRPAASSSRKCRTCPCISWRRRTSPPSPSCTSIRKRESGATWSRGTWTAPRSR